MPEPSRNVIDRYPVQIEKGEISMSSTFAKFSLVLAAAGALILSSGHRVAAGGDDWESSARKLEGTWQVHVTLQNCATHVNLGPPFLSLLTFAHGGTMTETTSNAMFFPAERGPGHGVWHYTGDHKFNAASLAMITLNGALVKTQKISQTIEIGDNPDEFTVPDASVQFFDSTGKPLVTGCATATGQRFE
jgi:hypothetical protein